jgi:hypothetical protein
VWCNNSAKQVHFYFIDSAITYLTSWL